MPTSPSQPRREPPRDSSGSLTPFQPWSLSLWRPNTSTPFESSTPDTPPAARILIAENDPGVLEIMVMTLQCSGFNVTTAADGEEAFGLLTHADYDLLITDHNMPRLTGLELIARLRATGCHVPVILTSGLICEQDIPPAMRARIDAIITKPAGSQLLLDTIRRCLAHTSADLS